jgi:hypothetical protein
MSEINQKTFEDLGELTKVVIITTDDKEHPGWIMTCSETTLYLGTEIGSERIPLNKISGYKTEQKGRAQCLK